MKTIGQRYALCGGLRDESQWVPFCKVLNDAAAFGQDLGIQITTKHHHGLNNTPVELLGWMYQVNHPNFRLFFDPGTTSGDTVEATTANARANLEYVKRAIAAAGV